MSHAPLVLSADGVYCTVCFAKSDYRGLRLKHFDSCVWFRSLLASTTNERMNP